MQGRVGKVAVGWLLAAVGLAATDPAVEVAREVVKVPIDARGVVEVASVVDAIATRFGLDVARPAAGSTLPARGFAASLARTVLVEGLGPGTSVAFGPAEVAITIEIDARSPEQVGQLAARLRAIADRANKAVKKTVGYGMGALRSYRPNDPSRPTICLIHGINSSSGVFVHMIAPLEAAGYGLVVYDFPYNRDLDESAAAFRRDWAAFRTRVGERQPWAIVAHSMGSLLARDLVEGDPAAQGQVASLVMLGPVNGGSRLAGAQTVLQWVEGLQAARGRSRADALGRLGDGLGEAAADLTPGSTFLKKLDARPRNPAVPYHIIAGDAGFVSAATRASVEAQIRSAGRVGGFFGGLTRLAEGDLIERLDEVGAGRGDGCVAVARTRLDGVADHVTIPANHLELIRAPLMYPEPGPVTTMPLILDRLGRDFDAGRQGVGREPALP